MSRIADLIADLCPNGVEFKALGDVGTFHRGNGLQKKDLVGEGVGAIHYGQVFTTYGMSTRTTASFVAPVLAARLRRASPGDLVIATTSENDEDVCKAVAWLGEAEIAVSGDAYVYSHSLAPMYMAYFFQTDAFQSQKQRMITGTKVKRVSGADLAKVKVPVPPVEVQREIVRALDAFTSLEAELEAELEARRRQYEHYREVLLNSGHHSDVPLVRLADLGVFLRGRRFTKADFAPEGIGCIHYGEIYTRYGAWTRSVASHLRPDLDVALRYAQPGDVVVVDVGETVEDVGKAVAWLGEEPVAIHDHSYAFRHSMNPAFVSYVMQTHTFRAAKDKYVARTKVNTLLIDGFSRIRIPVPSLEEQERIVAILDTFDALVNDLSVGLPAELAARRKQYEYYRDKLLTFPEAA